MEKQMKAERERRAIILDAEAKEKRHPDCRRQKGSAILAAEAEKKHRIRRAEGEATRLS